LTDENWGEEGLKSGHSGKILAEVGHREGVTDEQGRGGEEKERGGKCRFHTSRGYLEGEITQGNGIRRQKTVERPPKGE